MESVITQKRTTVNRGLAFTLICLIYILVSYTWRELILTEQIYYNTYGEQVALDRIERFVNMQQRLAWIGYLLLPVIMAVKISLIAICLNIGTLSSEYRISFRQLFRAAVMAEGVFVIAAVVRTVWVIYFMDVQTLQDAQMFYPLSLLNVLDPENLEPWLLYPIQILNGFEILYWFVMAKFMQPVLNKSYRGSLGFVLSTYGVGIIVWIVLVTFLSINFS